MRPEHQSFNKLSREEVNLRNADLDKRAYKLIEVLFFTDRSRVTIP